MTVDIRRLTAHLSGSQQDEIVKAYKKRAENETAAFLWCFFLGWMGAHRFYLRQWGQAIIHLLIVVIVAGIIVVGVLASINPTVVVLAALPFGLAALIWEVVDLFRIDDEVEARNLKLAETLIAGSMLADTSVLQSTQAELDKVVHNVAEIGVQSTNREEATTAVAAEGELPANGSVSNAAAAAAVEAGTGSAFERYEAVTTIQASDEPDVKPEDEQPVQPGTRDLSETEAVSLGELSAAAVEETANEDVAQASGVEADETVTRAHTESGFSSTDSVDTVISEGTASSEDAVISADMTPMTTADAEAPTWPNLPAVAEEELQAAPVPVDYTDMGGSEPATPVADIDSQGVIGAAPLTISLGDETAGADVITPPPDDSATVPAESFTPPVVPVVELSAGESAFAATPAEPIETPAPTVPVETPAKGEESEAPETLAELAGLSFGVAGVGGVAAEAAQMPPVNPAPSEPSTPEIAHAVEEIPHSSQLLKRIRVTRQIKVNGEIIEETSAEALIDADADPEPVREKLRQQLHTQAAARMAELGITEDQSNS